MKNVQFIVNQYFDNFFYYYILPSLYYNKIIFSDWDNQIIWITLKWNVTWFLLHINEEVEG